ncbi:MAG: hypothetical protein WBA22_15190 [Candidatus Methanofastidiosia archaeon]
MFLSESFILILVWKFHQAVMDLLCNGLYCRYSPHFGMIYSGMSYNGIPWMLFFHNGLFWGIPLLAFTMWFQARRQKRREDMTDTPKDLADMQEMDEIERVKRTRESYKKGHIPLRKIFLLFILFMVWDFAVEYFPVQSRLWSYPCTSFTFRGLSSFKIFFVGLAGPILCFINILIESWGRGLPSDQVGPPERMSPRVREKGWAWNILIRVMAYNLAIILLWLSLVFMGRNDEELWIGLVHSIYGG